WCLLNRHRAKKRAADGLISLPNRNQNRRRRTTVEHRRPATPPTDSKPPATASSMLSMITATNISISDNSKNKHNLRLRQMSLSKLPPATNQQRKPWRKQMLQNWKVIDYLELRSMKRHCHSMGSLYKLHQTCPYLLKYVQCAMQTGHYVS
ncbi:Peptidyl-prolyl cis-trans isomerase, partial [Actinidia chinensis var. chinensis]